MTILLLFELIRPETSARLKTHLFNRLTVAKLIVAKVLSLRTKSLNWIAQDQELKLDLLVKLRLKQQQEE